MKAKNCLYKGCTPYLAFLIDMKKERNEMQKIPVLCEYMEVFPENILRLPFDRQVEFRIYLLLRTILIVKRMKE